MLTIELNTDVITKQINLFRDFLVASWPSFVKLMEYHYWDGDSLFEDEWVQSNWEFLVERELLEKGQFLRVLSVYDLKRVTFQKEKANYCVYALPNEDAIDLETSKNIYALKNLRLCGFLTKMNNGCFGYYPPFDVVELFLDEEKKGFLVELKKLKFEIRPL